jgi:hypothetical protein
MAHAGCIVSHLSTMQKALAPHIVQRKGMEWETRWSGGAWGKTPPPPAAVRPRPAWDHISAAADGSCRGLYRRGLLSLPSFCSSASISATAWLARRAM